MLICGGKGARIKHSTTDRRVKINDSIWTTAKIETIQLPSCHWLWQWITEMSECIWTWRGSPESCSSELFVSIFFFFWVGFAYNHARIEIKSSHLSTPNIWDDNKKKILCLVQVYKVMLAFWLSKGIVVFLLLSNQLFLLAP